MRTMAGALVASGPVVALGCETGPSYDQWAATDGAAGRINLDEVQEAFKKSKSGSDFEKRVNQIFEGDNLVLVRVKQGDTGTTVEAWENLDGDYVISEGDDLLFTILEKPDKSHEMRGYGANGYYHQPFGTGSFLLSYMMISAMSPYGGYYYHAPRGATHVRTLNNQRTSYRRSSEYTNQVSKNSKYFKKQSNFAGSKYKSSGNSLSSSRRTYQSGKKTSGQFRNSTTGVRSSWGASNRGSSFGRGSRGGFGGGGRGFGGGQSIIGDL